MTEDATAGKSRREKTEAEGGRKTSVFYAKRGTKDSFFCQIRQDTQSVVFQKVFHRGRFFEKKPMENSVDIMENQVKSRVFSKKRKIDLWKTFRKILSSLFLKKIIFHILHKSAFFDKGRALNSERKVTKRLPCEYIFFKGRGRRPRRPEKSGVIVGKG